MFERDWPERLLPFDGFGIVLDLKKPAGKYFFSVSEEYGATDVTSSPQILRRVHQ